MHSRRTRARARAAVGDALVDIVEGAVRQRFHVLEDLLVEVGSAEAFDAGGRADHSEGVVFVLPEERHIEGSAAEVVHRDRLTGLDLLPGEVMESGGLGLADELDVRQSDSGECGSDQAEAMITPRRGVRHGDDRRSAALVLLGALDDPLCEHSEDVLGCNAQVADDDRRLVADPALELAHDAIGVFDGSPLGGLAHHDAAVGVEVHHRRHRGLPRAEFERFVHQRAIRAPTSDRRCRVARSDVDAKNE